MQIEKLVGIAVRTAVCIAVAALAVYAGRRLRTHLGTRHSVAEWTAKIAGAKPWIADAARQAKDGLSILVFKKERIVEVHANGWGKPLVYGLTGFSGRLGPKLREGDRQIPEGVYGIEYLNPNSMFHLSLKVSYPNEFDKRMARVDGRTNLGGDIMIHGGCVTVGCIPVGDEAIEELFCLVAAVGKAKTTVVISPYDMRNGRIAALEASPHHWYGALCDEIYMKLVNRHVGEFNPPNACSRILRNRL